MSQSKELKVLLKQLNESDVDRLIRMGWEDRTPFEAIQFQFGISPNMFVKLMRSQLERKAFDRWRRRVHQQGQLKNQKTRGFKVTRFKCTRQSVDGLTKGWK